MILGVNGNLKFVLFSMLYVLALNGLVAASAQAQQVDPGRAIDGDLAVNNAAPTKAPPVSGAAPSTASVEAQASPASVTDAAPPAAPVEAAAKAKANDKTFQKDDLVGAAEGVFGKGAAGLAGMIEDLLRKQGEPNGYIVGREGGGALLIGLRYGSGTLHHKVEGTRPVYWTGPSLGLDLGANAGNTFVLVYNLYNTDEIFSRFAAGEGQAYLVGGFNVSYLRRGDVVLIPVRMGVGLRLGINAGYMKFSKKQKLSPF